MRKKTKDGKYYSLGYKPTKVRFTMEDLARNQRVRREIINFMILTSGCIVVEREEELE